MGGFCMFAVGGWGRCDGGGMEVEWKGGGEGMMRWKEEVGWRRGGEGMKRGENNLLYIYYIL